MRGGRGDIEAARCVTFTERELAELAQMANGRRLRHGALASPALKSACAKLDAAHSRLRAALEKKQ